MRRAAVFLTVLAAVSGVAFARTAAAAGPSQSLSFHSLSIETASGRHDFSVEEALTDEQREIGLMNRRALADDRGMIFAFPSSQPVSMWMENTLIPLDMLFIRADGTVAGIARNAKPLSETIIPSPGPVRFVLEIGGGVAKAIGAEPGDRVSSKLIDETTQD